MASQGTPATALLTKQKVKHTLHPYEISPDSPNYGALVADAIGADPARVFKTLVTEVDGALTVAVVPVTGEIDLKALATAAGGKKAAMADRDLAEKTTGYVRGGISPLGQRKRLPTVIDQSALDGDLIYVSAGKRGLQLRLAPTDLVRLTSATLAPIART
ncbi:Cys-tRNA(Pro) deacylase [Catellatospora sichuanensis]|uniref:Cys-tRNA(Pro) deacylase n=1 Tax=Catellatospora sichuanensis TaxID=1969805 RepID=UPI0011833297|nr:Cys-tRNA(Pro) deacylase [Catellatospora sichuanensis]